MRVTLQPHPDTPANAVTAIAVDIVREGAVLRLKYRATGRMDDVLIPAPANSERADELWKETCFEAFLKGAGGAYCEFNFAPSSRWAAYAFDDYRAGMREYALAPFYVEFASGPDWCELVAEVTPGETGPWRVGLSALIEETDGTKSYWAVKHAPGKPDFHHSDAFELELP